MKNTNLEDDFHNQKQNSWLTVHIYNKDPSFSLQRFVQRSTRLAHVVWWIGYGPVSKVLENTHEAIVLVPGTNRVKVDHSKIGGPRFLRLAEALLESEPRKLPASNNMLGFVQCVRHIPSLLHFTFRPRVDNTNGLLLYGTKRYHILSSDAPGTGKRFSVYHAFLQDALQIRGVNELSVGFSVVFEGGCNVNDVGIVLLQFRLGMSSADLKHAFLKYSGTAIATNFLSNIGSFTKSLTRQDGTVVRSKLDLIITSLVVDSKVPVSIAVQAAGPVYEGAYVSLFSRIDPGGHVDVLAAVSSHDPTWFKKSSAFELDTSH